MFFAGSVLGLIASIVVVAANYLLALSALRFSWFSPRACVLFSGLGLVFCAVEMALSSKGIATQDG